MNIEDSTQKKHSSSNYSDDAVIKSVHLTEHLNISLLKFYPWILQWLTIFVVFYRKHEEYIYVWSAIIAQSVFLCRFFNKTSFNKLDN